MELLLFFTAVVGHATLVVFSHNWWYGQALPRKLTDVIQLLHGLLVLAGPIGFWLAAGLDLLSLFPPGTAYLWHSLAAGYVALCWLTGVVLLPAVTLARWRHRPSALVKETSEVVDVAQELGHRPIGEGKHRWLAYLPGNEIFTVDFTRKTLVLPRLPAEWEGLTILHLGDLHFCGTPALAWYEWVAERCAALEPDILAITGDFVDGRDRHAWLAPVLRRLRCREMSLAILGNHDKWYGASEVRARLADLGFVVLGNSWQERTLRGRTLIVVGNETPWMRPGPDLSELPEGFRLCLSHTPDNVAWGRRHGLDLMLCGHVHGGQIRLPVLGSIVVPSRCGRRYDCGVFDEPPTVMHVTRGLAGKHPVRYGCRPEVALLTLCRTGESVG